MKKKELMESMTMPEIKAAIVEAVNNYNATNDAAERVKLEVEYKTMCDAYNELALLTSYAELIKAEKPVVAIAQAYSYKVIGVKAKVVDDVVNGKNVTIKVASVDETGSRTHNLLSFMEWAEAHNRKIAAKADWKGKLEDARKAINGEFQKVMDSEEGYKISKTIIKNTMQAAFDSIVFVAGESGKNAIYPNKDGVNIVIAIAAELKEAVENGEVEFTLQFLGKKKWSSIVFKILHLAVKGKTLKYVYGDPESDKPEEEPATEAEAEAEA